MKVAITGAAGYVGSLLVRAHAARGDAVNALARDAGGIPALPGVSPYAADVRAAASIPGTFIEGVDVLYHCAAEATRESLMREVNVDATHALLLRARGTLGHWVQLSSLSVYGTPRSGTVEEDSPLRPRTAYARTKLAADELVARHASGAFSYTLVRPAAVIGPNMRTPSLHALIDAVARGYFCFIGPPGAIGNYVHEENMVDALLLCATRSEAKHRIYNLSQNVPFEHIVEAIALALNVARRPPRIWEWAARLAAHIVPALPLTLERVDALTSRVEYRADRIERELGYRHRKSIADGVRELAAAHRAGAS